MRSIASVSVGYAAPGGGAQHRRPEQDGVGLGRDCDGNAERVRVRVQPTRVRGRAAARDEQLDAASGRGERVDDVARGIRERLQCGEVPAREVLDVVAQLHTGERARELRIGERRTVAEDTRLPVAVDGHSRRITVGSEPVEDAVERGERIVTECGPRGMHGEHLVEERAGRGDPGFGAPHARQDRLVVRPPHAGDVVPLARQREMTRGRTGDDREAPLEPRVVARGAEHSQRAGVGVDQRCRDRRARRDAEHGGRVGCDCADAFARHPHVRADARESVFGEVGEPDLGEVRRVPAPLVTEVRPLADRRAQRTVDAPRRPPGQIVGEIEPVRRAAPGVGPVAPQPAQLGRLHLGRDRPADELQHRMTGRIDRTRIVDRAVIHPDDDVPRVIAVDSSPNRSTVRIDRDERAGRVEADAGDRVRRIDAAATAARVA